MKTPKAPLPADPEKTAAAQTTSNVNTAIANSYIGNANEVGPYGSVNYAVSGYQDVDGRKVPTFTKTTTLDPAQQQLLDQQNALGAQMNGIAGRQLTNLDSTLSQPISTEGLTQVPQYDRQHFEDAIYGRLQPQLDRDRAALETKLANQGVMPGSEAYREAIALSDRAMNDARYGATLNAGQYAGQELQAAGTQRERELQERLSLRNQPINEISALMSGGQVTVPQFSQFQGGNVSGTDIAGIYQNNYANQMAAYNAMQSGRNSMLGGIAGLAGTILGGPIGGAAASAMMGGIGA